MKRKLVAATVVVSVGAAWLVIAVCVVIVGANDLDTWRVRGQHGGHLLRQGSPRHSLSKGAPTG